MREESPTTTSGCRLYLGEDGLWEVLRLREVRLSPVAIRNRDEAEGYDFLLSLAKRGAILEDALRSGAAIWPPVVDETLMLRWLLPIFHAGQFRGLGGLCHASAL